MDTLTQSPPKTPQPHAAGPRAIAAWLAFVAAGLCFVAAGYIGSCVETWRAFYASYGVELPVLVAMQMRSPVALPLGLVATGLALLGVARVRRDGRLRSLALSVAAYPSALIAALIACALVYSNALVFEEMQKSLSSVEAEVLPPGIGLGVDAPPPAQERLSWLVDPVNTRFELGEWIRIVEVRGPRGPLRSGQRYRLRGEYQVRSPGDVLQHWCSDGALVENPRLILSQRRGTFTMDIEIKKPGALHISLYPREGGESLGGLWYRIVDELPAARTIKLSDGNGLGLPYYTGLDGFAVARTESLAHQRRLLLVFSGRRSPDARLLEKRLVLPENQAHAARATRVLSLGAALDGQLRGLFSADLARHYQPSTLPSCLVLDPGGAVVAEHAGVQTGPALNTFLEDALGPAETTGDR